MFILLVRGFPGGTMVKTPSANAGDPRDTGSIPGSGRSPGGGAWQPTLIFLPAESHGQMSLVGYSPWGHQHLDVTEVISMHVHTPIQSKNSEKDKDLKNKI